MNAPAPRAREGGEGRGRREEDPRILACPAFEPERRLEQQRRMEEPFVRRAVWQQLAIFAGGMALWPFPFPNPLKLLVVLFHELSHALTGLATGAMGYGIAINPGGAGVTLLDDGGNPLLILLAGYTGSLLVGAALYAAQAVWRPGEVWGALLAFCAASRLLRWPDEFTSEFLYGAVVLLAAGFLFSAAAKRFWLRALAATSCLYPILDVTGGLFGAGKDGFAVRGELVGSDMAQIARLTGLPEAPLSLAGAALGVFMVIYLTRWSARIEARTIVKNSLFRSRKKKRAGFEYALYDPSRPNEIPEYTIR